MSSRGRGKFHQKNHWNGSRGSLKTGSRDALDQTCDENNSKYSTYSNSDAIDRQKRPEQQYYATKSLKPTERDDMPPPPPPPVKPKHTNDFRLDDFRESSFPRGQQRPHPMQNTIKNTQNRSGRQSSEPRQSDYSYYNQTLDYKNDRHRETESSERYFRNGIGNPRKNGQGRFKMPPNIEALPPRLQKKFLLDNGLDLNLLNKATPSSSSDRQSSHSTNKPVTSKLAQSPPFRADFYRVRSRSSDVSHNDQEYTSNTRPSNVNYSSHNNRDGGPSDFRSSNRSLHQYESNYSQPKSSNRRDHQRPYDTMKSSKTHKSWSRSGGVGNSISEPPDRYKTYERSGTGSGGRQSPFDKRDSTDTFSSLPITINNYSEPIAPLPIDEPANFVSFETIFLR